MGFDGWIDVGGGEERRRERMEMYVGELNYLRCQEEAFFFFLPLFLRGNGREKDEKIKMLSWSRDKTR